MTSIVPQLEYNYLIGFRSADEDKIDDYFDRFCYQNKDDIRTRGTSFIVLNDGTKIKKVYTNYDNRLHEFDQYILADNANGMWSRIRQDYLTKDIKWTDKVPDEYKILYYDVYGV